jgi:DNA (cytosine-5)-methyltransferase 1
MVLVDLFSGIGGFSLAAEWAGIQPVLQVEIDPWCQKVLAKHWPHVRRIADVREVTAEIVADAISKPKLGQTEQADPGRIRGEARMVAEDSGDCGARPIILSGGFPCQPASVAGKRRGREDNRWLWPEMFRVIREVRPSYVVAENVLGLLSLEQGLAFEHCCTDLESVGYTVQPLVIPACAVNAPHRRDRVWIVAHAKNGQDDRRDRGIMAEAERCGQGGDPAAVSGGQDAADAASDGLHKQNPSSDDAGKQSKDCQQSRNRRTSGVEGLCSSISRRWQADWWATQSRLCRVADGLPAGLDGFVGQWDNGEWPGVPRVATGIKDRVNRLKGLGNAIVPQVAYEIFKTIVEVEHEDSV